MDVRCGNCNKLFRVADEKIAGKGIKFRCSKCSDVVTITKEDYDDYLQREAAKAELAGKPASSAAATESASPAPPAPPQPQAPAESQAPAERSVPEPQPAPSQEEAQTSSHHMPSASLSDFDFSDPHEAAQNKGDESFGSTDFTFAAPPDHAPAASPEPQQQTAPEPEPEMDLSAALRMPDEPMTEEEPQRSAPEPEPEIDLSSALRMPDEPMTEEEPHLTGPGPEEEQEIDLAAALKMPDEPVEERKPQPAPVVAAPKAAPVPEQERRPEPEAEPEDEDLGKALAMPQTEDPSEEPAHERSASHHGSDEDTVVQPAAERKVGSMTMAVIAGSFFIVAGLIGYGYLARSSAPEKRTVGYSQPAPKTAPKAAPAIVTPEGILVKNAAAYRDPATGDIVITAVIQNTTDVQKAGWYLVATLYDAQDKPLADVRMANGQQLYSGKDYELLGKRGAKIDEVKARIRQAGNNPMPPQGSASIELRVMDPPAGSSGFLPVLQSFAPSQVFGGTSGEAQQK